jgi:hypothetical protein
MRRERSAGTRPRVRPLSMTGNSATPQRRNRNPSPAILAVARSAIRPGQQPHTAGLLRLRQDTPPNAFARDSLLVADVLARGSLPSATFPGFRNPSGHAGRRLAAHSCGGSRGIACPQARAPRSLLIPCGNHRHRSCRAFRERSSRAAASFVECDLFQTSRRVAAEAERRAA